MTFVSLYSTAVPVHVQGVPGHLPLDQERVRHGLQEEEVNERTKPLQWIRPFSIDINSSPVFCEARIPGEEHLLMIVRASMYISSNLA